MANWRDPPVLLVLRCGLLRASIAERLRHRAAQLPPGPVRDWLLTQGTA